MGEFIFLDKPAIKLTVQSFNPNKATHKLCLTDEELDSLMKQVNNLSSEAKLLFYKLEDVEVSNWTKELKIFAKNGSTSVQHGPNTLVLFLNVALINHSCAPNVAIEPTEEGSCEARAIKDISKGEEVTSFYRCFGDFTWEKFGCNVEERMKFIKKTLCFDCKCCVCSGNVPGQEDILRELIDLFTWIDLLMEKLPPHPIAYRRQELLDLVYAIVKFVDLSLRLYVGSIEDKTRALGMLANFANRIQDEELLGKAKYHLKKLAEETKLKYVMKRYEEI